MIIIIFQQFSSSTAPYVFSVNRVCFLPAYVAVLFRLQRLCC